MWSFNAKAQIYRNIKSHHEEGRSGFPTLLAGVTDIELLPVWGIDDVFETFATLRGRATREPRILSEIFQAVSDLSYALYPGSSHYPPSRVYNHQDYTDEQLLSVLEAWDDGSDPQETLDLRVYDAFGQLVQTEGKNILFEFWIKLRDRSVYAAVVACATYYVRDGDRVEVCLYPPDVND